MRLNRGLSHSSATWITESKTLEVFLEVSRPHIAEIAIDIGILSMLSEYVRGLELSRSLLKLAERGGRASYPLFTGGRTGTSPPTSAAEAR
jgi:hypothetical protein